jgi:hypothetical protein
LQDFRSTSDNDENKRSAFYKEHEVENPLRFLITQEKWPSLRSEAWFVFALMSRSKDGAEVVMSVLDEKAVEGVLIETITGEKPQVEEDVAADDKAEDSQQFSAELASAASELQLEPQQVDPKQKASMAKVDRENALILCTELMKNSTSGLAPQKLALFRGLVRDGTQIVITDRTRTQADA